MALSRAAIFTAALVFLPHAAIAIGAMALVLCESLAATCRPTPRFAIYRVIRPSYVLRGQGGHA